jgi:hypothetical protein
MDRRTDGERLDLVDVPDYREIHDTTILPTGGDSDMT